MSMLQETLEAPYGISRKGAEPQSRKEGITITEELIANSTARLEMELQEREGLLLPRVAAVELLHEFKLIASALSPRDRSLQDDLVQEMCLGALRCTEAHTPSYYCWLGAWRGRNFLHWWLDPMKKTKRREKPREFDEFAVV